MVTAHSLSSNSTPRTPMLGAARILMWSMVERCPQARPDVSGAMPRSRLETGACPTMACGKCQGRVPTTPIPRSCAGSLSMPAQLCAGRVSSRPILTTTTANATASAKLFWSEPGIRTEGHLPGRSGATGSMRAFCC